MFSALQVRTLAQVTAEREKFKQTFHGVEVPYR